jgi:hypothetical protein
MHGVAAWQSPLSVAPICLFRILVRLQAILIEVTRSWFLVTGKVLIQG